jgi:hypothetical protein
MQESGLRAFANNIHPEQTLPCSVHTARLQTPAAARRSEDTPDARGDGAHLA